MGGYAKGGIPMFRSIKWRLITSYVVLTLLTVSVLGALAFYFMSQSVKKQENDFLAANANTIAEQASQFLWPILRISDLRQLANTASVLANVRVRIYNADHELLVDTGPYTGIDEFIWVQLFDNLNLETATNPTGAFIIPFSVGSGSSRTSRGHIISLIMENFPKETRFSVIQRTPQGWGYHMSFEDTSEPIIQAYRKRSSQTLSLPIIEEGHTHGYVELLDGPDYGTETLNTMTRAFLFAAGGSLLLAGVVGLLISGRVTSPIIQLTEVAGQMSSGDLSARAPSYGKDEIGQLSGRFNQMAERLEESFRTLASERDTLRRFISDASHELRTPITALKNFNELLLDQAAGDPQAQEEFLIQSQDQIERLEWITQNLLNLSRLDAGLTPLRLERKDVNEILKSVASTFKMQAEKEGIRLHTETHSPSFEVLADPSLLEIALSNLLENALKYTPKGGKINLSARVAEGKIQFRVQDTGIGINQEDLPHVFEPFYRGKSVSNEGSGLGLAMVESVVKAHGGNVRVESEPGSGSIFTIELPNINKVDMDSSSDSANQ
jgi:signal transduction histidine kinase